MQIYVLIYLLGVFLASISQVMLKKAAMKKYKNTVLEYVNPLVITAYVIFVLTTLMSVWAYKGVPLSLGPILEGTQYIYVTFFGVLIFGEKLGRNKVIALVIILAGIALYGFGISP